MEPGLFECRGGDDKEEGGAHPVGRVRILKQKKAASCEGRGLFVDVQTT